jgi:signal transduction histidine kinase
VELQIANQTLTEEINERKQAEEALRDSRQHLQVLSKRLVEVQEEERRAIARELHDRVGQTLAALNINLIIMNGQLPEEAIQRIGSRMSDSMQLTSEAIALVRNVMTDLRPAVLDDYGLQAALQSYIEEYKSRYSIDVLLDQPETAIPRLDPGLEMTVLRIAQEALTNVARHSQAGRAIVSLRLADHTTHLTVEDDGVGMEAPQGASRPDSHGLKIMRERAEAFGGNIQVGAASGKGTRVEARIPVESRAQNRVQQETGE